MNVKILLVISIALFFMVPTSASAAQWLVCETECACTSQDGQSSSNTDDLCFFHFEQPSMDEQLNTECNLSCITKGFAGGTLGKSQDPNLCGTDPSCP